MAFTVSHRQEITKFPHLENIQTSSRLKGGILANTSYTWQALGPYLEVRDTTKKCWKVGWWTFGSLLKDTSTEIVFVEELKRPRGGLGLLAVALHSNTSGGTICLFNAFNSKVVRAINIQEKISSLHIVDPGVDVLNSPGPLRDFDGVIAVGTEGGNVYLVDLCRQICENTSTTLRNELYPTQLKIITPNQIDGIYEYRREAITNGEHLAIHLNVVLDSKTEHFTLKGPKNENKLFVNKEEVKISALCYCPQLTSILVGFNFGAFQLWDLTTFQLAYTSPLCEDYIPITRFAFQEPTDDPRDFCYIWVCYSNLELRQSGLPLAVMYSLLYETKEYHEGLGGFLYQGFHNCTYRFQIELGALDNNDRARQDPKGGVCLGMQPISKVSSKYTGLQPTKDEVLALCLISWTVCYPTNEVESFCITFDLNQWYKEQMPTFTKWSNTSDYILRMNLSKLAVTKLNKLHCLAVEMNQDSLRQYVAVQKLEEHFRPTSLTFDLLVLSRKEMIFIRVDSLQKALLQQIQTMGPICLLKPKDIYLKICKLGMTPIFVDVGSNLEVSPELKREVILDVAIEQNLINWLYSCAIEWANGRFCSSNCSLDFLLSWAFQRTVNLKLNCDDLCAPLFDFSQTGLDDNATSLLSSCRSQINILSKFYSYVMNHLYVYIARADVALEQRNSIEMAAVYFDVLQWMMNVGLLPERHSSEVKFVNYEKISAPYPVQELTESYNEQRGRLQMLSKERFNTTNSSDSLLFIDNLINNKCGGELLQRQWQEDGGSGLYPPPSLQSLLRTYLVPGADISDKHLLVLYLFLDLATILDQNVYSNVVKYLIKFPAVFKVTPSLIKITQAFWQLDHGDCANALEQLMDPFVLADDLKPWHHTIAMRSLLLHNQQNMALFYMQVKKPPITDDKDILTAISLFVSNNMLAEAFNFMKKHCQEEELFLMHLFNECKKNDSLHQLLYKCLDVDEEKAFLKYLKEVEDPTLRDLQVFYFLLRSRFVEGFDAHASLRRNKPESRGLIGQRNATKTDQIVKIFKDSLPDVNRDLVEFVRKEKNSIWKTVPKPTPMSVFVHDNEEKILYKSTFIHAAISKARDTFDQSFRKNEFGTEDIPFLRTPVAFKRPLRDVTPVVTPKMIKYDENDETAVPSPAKRLKLSPKEETAHWKLLTPLVKRKKPEESVVSYNSNVEINTPQSILKVTLLCVN